MKRASTIRSKLHIFSSSLSPELQAVVFSCLFGSPIGGLASLIAQSVKNPPAMQETRVRFLGWEDPLKKETAIHSSILAGKIPWTEKPGGLQSMGLQRVRYNWAHTQSYPRGYIMQNCSNALKYRKLFSPSWANILKKKKKSVGNSKLRDT